MNSFDFLIIYLTIGAPLSVFYFLQNRKEQNEIRLWTKTILTFVFWMPFAFRLLMQNNRKMNFFAEGNASFLKSDKAEIEIFLFQKRLEKMLQESDLQISIFEFREVIERYVGLTLAKSQENGKTSAAKKEIFQIESGRNVEIGTICLNRRNLKRLTFHQIQARRDFFQIINQLSEFAADRENFIDSVISFFRLINDVDAQIGEVIFEKAPDEKNFASNHSEKFLWNTETHNSPPVKSKTIQLQSLHATANSSAKD
jgi:hypothetical protein